MLEGFKHYSKWLMPWVEICGIHYRPLIKWDFLENCIVALCEQCTGPTEHPPNLNTEEQTIAVWIQRPLR